MWATTLEGAYGSPGARLSYTQDVSGKKRGLSHARSIYLFSSYYALVGSEEGPDVGRRCQEQQAWQGLDTDHFVPQPLGLEGTSRSPNSCPARSTLPSPIRIFPGY